MSLMWQSILSRFQSGSKNPKPSRQGANVAYPSQSLYIACPQLAAMYPGQLSATSQTRLPDPEETCVFAITGWRLWTTPMFQEILLSNNKTEWKPYQRLEARCLANGFNPTPSDPAGLVNKNCSGVYCSCGIYAYKKQQDAEWGENRPETDNHIWGEVWLWGRVVEHETGYRAQYAYPKSLVDTGGIARRLATVYGCEVITVTPAERPTPRLDAPWYSQYYYMNTQGQITPAQQAQTVQQANSTGPFYGTGLSGLLGS